MRYVRTPAPSAAAMAPYRLSLWQWNFPLAWASYEHHIVVCMTASQYRQITSYSRYPEPIVENGGVIPPDSLNTIRNVLEVKVSQHYLSHEGIRQVLGEEAWCVETPHMRA